MVVPVQSRVTGTKSLDLNEPYPDLNLTLIALLKHDQSLRHA